MTQYTHTITKEEIDYLVEHGHLPEKTNTEEIKEDTKLDTAKEANKKTKKDTKKEDTKSK